MSLERTHSGIIVAPQQQFSVGEELRRIMRLISRRTADQMRNRLEFLSSWARRDRRARMTVTENPWICQFPAVLEPTYRQPPLGTGFPTHLAVLTARNSYQGVCFVVLEVIECWTPRNLRMHLPRTITAFLPLLCAAALPLAAQVDRATLNGTVTV